MNIHEASHNIAKAIGFTVLLFSSSFLAGIGFEAGSQQLPHQPHIIIVKAEDVGIKT